jgi:hypothetical protein
MELVSHRALSFFMRGTRDRTVGLLPLLGNPFRRPSNRHQAGR